MSGKWKTMPYLCSTLAYLVRNQIKSNEETHKSLGPIHLFEWYLLHLLQQLMPIELTVTASTRLLFIQWIDILTTIFLYCSFRLICISFPLHCITIHFALHSTHITGITLRNERSAYNLCLNNSKVDLHASIFATLTSSADMCLPSPSGNWHLLGIADTCFAVRLWSEKAPLNL